MAVLNPPRTLPGLGRAIVNYLLDARRSSTEDDLVAAFKPEGLNPGAEAAGGLKNTISSLRAINVLETNSDGNLQLGAKVPPRSLRSPRTEFRTTSFRPASSTSAATATSGRRKLGDGHTSGARDLNRALTWVMAQDALGQPLSWTDNLQTMQTEQFGTTDQRIVGNHQ